MDGLETAALIRSASSRAHTPIIFVTADYGDEMRTARGYSLGAVDYIVVAGRAARSCAPRSRCSSSCTCWRSRRSARRRSALRLPRAGGARRGRASEPQVRVSGAGERRAFRIAESRRDDARAGPARRAVPCRCRRVDAARPRGVERRTMSRGPGNRRRTVAPHRIARRVECEWWRDAIERVIASGSGMSFNAGRAVDGAARRERGRSPRPTATIPRRRKRSHR